MPLSGRVERAAPPDTMCSRTVSASELSNSGTRREIIQWSEHGGDSGWLDQQRQAPLAHEVAAFCCCSGRRPAARPRSGQRCPPRAPAGSCMHGAPWTCAPRSRRQAPRRPRLQNSAAARLRAAAARWPRTRASLAASGWGTLPLRAAACWCGRRAGCCASGSTDRPLPQLDRGALPAPLEVTERHLERSPRARPRAARRTPYFAAAAARNTGR